MANSSSSKSKKTSNVGKGKVTPVQIAFIIERFLADNNYTNTIIAFRDEASDLFSKTRSKEVPKGLLGLADILDEYISLKEQRMAVDQEKRRVEMAFQGMNDVMRIFHSSGTGAAALPPSPPSLLPPATATPTGSLMASANPSTSGSPPGHAIHGSFLSNCQQLPKLPVKIAETNKFSTPIPNVSSSGKRKASKTAANIPPPPKKCRAQTSTNSHKMGGATTSARISLAGYAEDNTVSNSAVQSIPNTSIEESPVQGYSVAKSLFMHPPESRANSSSPKTPPQPLHFQNDNIPYTSLGKLPPSAIGSSSTPQKNIASSKCSVMSSETIIISPLKNKAYYTVERSYRVSSPLKPNSERMIKRDQVKGRLDFDQSVLPETSEEPVATDSSPSTTYEETPGSFDFDLPDFDFLDGDLSKLLVDMDIECERMFSCQQSSNPANSYSGMEQGIGDGCLETDQTLHDCGPSTLTGIISQKDMDIRGSDTITSMRSITKCIQIASPAKGRKCSSPSECHQLNVTQTP